MTKYWKGYYISDNKNEILEHYLDVKDLLSQTDLGKEREEAIIKESINNSLCYAIFDEKKDKIIGFTRIVTVCNDVLYL